ncbi:MAG: hypothetical protein ABIR30_08560 [Chitinophagaceae bacterium]
MKALCFLPFVFIFNFSCKTKQATAPVIDYSDFSKKIIFIQGLNPADTQNDTLGTLSIQIPHRLDTFYQWHRTSDCTQCGWNQYRFADKDYPQFAEAGFIWTYIPDSVYQITIRHKPLKEAADSVLLRELKKSDLDNIWFSQQNDLVSSDDFEYLRKDFKSINGHSFLLYAFTTPRGYLTNKETLFVTAATNLKDRTLFIIGECGAKDTTGFIDNMYKAISSAEIKEK